MIPAAIHRRRREHARRRREPHARHIFSFRFPAENGFRRLATILVRGHMDQAAALSAAYAEAAKRGREPWCVDIHTMPVPRATPALDAICRRHTGFTSFLELLTAPAGYCPSIRLDLAGREGAMLARAYGRMQARSGDKRRAFVTGHPVRRRARTP